jgi:hypothetical protein
LCLPLFVANAAAVKTNLPQAEISINGTYVGNGTAEAKDWPVGQRAVKATAPGRLPASTTVTVSPNAMTPVALDLKIDGEALRAKRRRIVAAIDASDFDAPRSSPIRKSQTRRMPLNVAFYDDVEGARRLALPGMLTEFARNPTQLKSN